jgi:hypothetical protein
VTIKSNEMVVTIEEVKGIFNIKVFAAELLDTFTGESTILFDFAKTVLSHIFIFIVPILFSLLSLISQCISFLIQIGKVKKGKRLLGNSFSVITMQCSSVVCISLLFSLICGFDCSRLLISALLLINLVCFVSIIKSLRENEAYELSEPLWEKKEKQHKVKKERQFWKTNISKESEVKCTTFTEDEEKRINELLKTYEKDEEEKEYKCPRCGNKLKILVPGSCALYCDECTKGYNKEDSLLVTVNH